MGRLDRAGRMVAGARARIGVPFRPQGRGHLGLDCLGLVLCALHHAGWMVQHAPDYRLGRHDISDVLLGLRRAGLTMMARAAVRPGDILMQVPGAAQVHFAVCSDLGLVEASLSVGRVVERTIWADEIWEWGWRVPADGVNKEGRIWDR